MPLGMGEDAVTETGRCGAGGYTHTEYGVKRFRRPRMSNLQCPYACERCFNTVTGSAAHSGT
jgi:hypothetical protein